MYYVIAYLIGNIKYKDVHTGHHDTRQEAIDQYRKLLDEYIDNREFVMALLNDQFQVLTCWALQTPKQLKPAQELALKAFGEGEDLYIDPNLELINIFGSTIIEELKVKQMQLS